MLVLTQRVGEKIVIPEMDIAFIVLRIKGRAVCLGVAAPDGVSVRRGELTPNAVKPSTKR